MKIGKFFERLIKVPWRMVIGVFFYAANAVELRHWFFFGEAIESFRAMCLRMLGAKIGTNSHVRSRSFITEPKLLSLGDRSKIATGCRLFLYAPLEIGKDVEIGSGLTVLTSEHVFSDPEMPLSKQGASKAPVFIEDDVYIGANVTITSGVTIKSRTVVAAGAVVTKSIGGNVVIGGVPARILKEL